MQYITNSEKETKKVAESLAKWMQQSLRPRAQGRVAHHGNIVALTGELGAGKTTFVQGFAKGLGIKEKIISPTFVLIRQHKIPDNNKVLFHVDLYRLNNMKDLKQLGLEEIWSDPKNIVLIEWADKIKNLLPKEVIKIYLKVVNTTTRKITLHGSL
ncbi:tRNA (adenosine(37)-N6)-threonylcarbamoyltransferase complex ATPase subunit type 1 TsaE [Candidatus Daviesbacteria bacterium]|nr:tRNA (adenosine(37)-N6)-threonylcarbamoyltransferase complex ATPase subunit type 1 TsaE [Candidatus Daviesbacteria bacterium]